MFAEKDQQLFRYFIVERHGCILLNGGNISRCHNFQHGRDATNTLKTLCVFTSFLPSVFLIHEHSNQLLPYHGCSPQPGIHMSPEPHHNRISRVFQCLFSKHLSYSICKSRVHLHSSYQHVPRRTVRSKLSIDPLHMASQRR